MNPTGNVPTTAVSWPVIRFGHEIQVARFGCETMDAAQEKWASAQRRELHVMGQDFLRLFFARPSTMT